MYKTNLSERIKGLISEKSTCFHLAFLCACYVCACCHILLSLSVLCSCLRVAPMPDWLTAWLVGPHRPHHALRSVDSPIEFLLDSSAGENENIYTQTHACNTQELAPQWNSSFKHIVHLKTVPLRGSKELLFLNIDLYISSFSRLILVFLAVVPNLPLTAQ